ncbi:hypothetical protein FN846DRAFT_784668 [Sphaerosporella brunnea]|uniref:ER membrane protein complex subunit 7 beta-sandwich domain-containing protein n=1 Tax=Sphaerosporella brunnea TaxID=1250544 RepID=A0A5J5EKI3_9PEZI|nr:hypothetical protein FN846DRAFT_784668 [Sphaerosporella brunnea]
MKLQLLALSAYLSFAAALTTIRGSISPSQQLPNPSVLPADTTITLTTSGAQYYTRLRADNTFVFRNVSEGSYLLDTACSTHHFAPLRVDVARDGEVKVAQTFRGNPWSNVGEKKGVPIELQPVKAAEYYVTREGFNPMKMLGSPMILIAIFSVISMMFLPKLMDKMDPEFMAELEEQKKKRAATAQNQPNPLANFDMASFLAGRSKPSSPAPPAQEQERGGKRK